MLILVSVLGIYFVWMSVRMAKKTDDEMDLDNKRFDVWRQD